MNTTTQKRDQGFTIIEVVLVLAIAALIMLMVFIALPALQRNQRDTQRKNDISRLQSAVNNYKSSARGQLPTSGTGANGLTNTGANGFVQKYVVKGGEEFGDPEGDGAYQLTQAPGSIPEYTESGSNANVDIIYFDRGGNCGDGQTPNIVDSSSSRKMILIKPLEAGGIHCVSV